MAMTTTKQIRTTIKHDTISKRKSTVKRMRRVYAKLHLSVKKLTRLLVID